MPSVVDWVVAILAGIAGLALTAVSIGLYTQLDTESIRDVIVEQEVQPNGITRSELISAAEPFVDWLAVGLGITGLALMGFAVMYVRARQRTRRRVSQNGGTTATFVPCMVYGVVAASLISSVVPGLGAIAGGSVGAYLYDSDSGTRVGGITGLVAFALTLPLLGSIGVGMIAGGMAISELAGGAALAGIIAVSGLLGAAFSTGAGALGGYLIDRFA